MFSRDRLHRGEDMLHRGILTDIASRLLIRPAAAPPRRPSPTSSSLHEPLGSCAFSLSRWKAFTRATVRSSSLSATISGGRPIPSAVISGTRQQCNLHCTGARSLENSRYRVTLLPGHNEKSAQVRRGRGRRISGRDPSTDAACTRLIALIDRRGEAVRSWGLEPSRRVARFDSTNQRNRRKNAFRLNPIDGRTRSLCERQGRDNRFFVHTTNR